MGLVSVCECVCECVCVCVYIEGGERGGERCERGTFINHTHSDALREKGRESTMLPPHHYHSLTLTHTHTHTHTHTEAHHLLIRQKCMDYMQVEKDYFEPYVVGDMNDFLAYLEQKRRDGVWGDGVCVCACVCVFVGVCVFVCVCLYLCVFLGACYFASLSQPLS